MKTKATKIGKFYIYYCPRLNEMVIVMRTPKARDIDYTCAIHFENNTEWPINLYPEVVNIFRKESFEDYNTAMSFFIKDYQGLYYIGEL